MRIRLEIGEVAVVQDEFPVAVMRIDIQMIDTVRIEQRRPSLDAVYLISLLKQKFCQIRSILAVTPVIRAFFTRPLRSLPGASGARFEPLPSPSPCLQNLQSVASRALLSLFRDPPEYSQARAAVPEPIAEYTLFPVASNTLVSHFA